LKAELVAAAALVNADDRDGDKLADLARPVRPPVAMDR
jgi:hypothetical protein